MLQILLQWPQWHDRLSSLWSYALMVLLWNPCVDQPAPPFALPETPRIDAIEMRCLVGKKITVRRIDSEEKIELFVEFIKRLDAGWKTPGYGKSLPSVRYAFSVMSDDLQVAHFQFSPTQIRAWNDGADNPYRFHDLSEEDWRELMAILDIDDSFVQWDHSFVQPNVDDNQSEMDEWVKESLQTERVPVSAWSWQRSLVLFGSLIATYLTSFVLACAAVGVVEDSETMVPAIRVAYYPLIFVVRLMLRK